MNKGDELVERAAVRLEEVADRAAARGGFAGKLGGLLAEDSAFLRQLKPSLIKARAKGEAALDPAVEGAPAMRERVREPAADSAPPRGARTGGGSGGHGAGRNPLPIIGAAFAVGIAAARVLDWRGHAHPRH